VITVLETVRELLDDSKSNNSFSINGVDLARDVGIEKVL
jgi:hypothetical protein